MVPVVQLVRASDCGSECREFESLRAPYKNGEVFIRKLPHSFFVFIFTLLRLQIALRYLHSGLCAGHAGRATSGVLVHCVVGRW
jgi:hypothetical protein